MCILSFDPLTGNPITPQSAANIAEVLKYKYKRIGMLRTPNRTNSEEAILLRRNASFRLPPRVRELRAEENKVKVDDVEENQRLRKNVPCIQGVVGWEWGGEEGTGDGGA